MRVRIQILVGKWCLTLILASYTDIAASWSDFLKIFIIYLWCRFHKCMSWLQRTGSLKWYLFFLFKSLTPWVLFIKEIVTFFYVLLCRLSPRIDSMLSWTCIWGKKNVPIKIFVMLLNWNMNWFNVLSLNVSLNGS